MPSRARAASPVVALVLALTGCGSSGPEASTTATATATAIAATSTPESGTAAYASAQSDALGSVDAAAGEVLYLNPAQTGPSVLAQKIHTLTRTIRAAAKDVAKLRPPAGASARAPALQRREVAQLRGYAARLDGWVAAHPRRTVGAAADVVHGARRALDTTLDALAAMKLVR
jgi:hypothetical protein